MTTRLQVPESFEDFDLLLVLVVLGGLFPCISPALGGGICAAKTNTCEIIDQVGRTVYSDSCRLMNLSTVLKNVNKSPRVSHFFPYPFTSKLTL